MSQAVHALAERQPASMRRGSSVQEGWLVRAASLSYFLGVV